MDIKTIVSLYKSGLSSTQIGKIYGVSHRTILNWMDAAGVQRRTLPDSHYAYNKKERPEEFSDYDIMYDLYVTQHKTKEQLGEMFECAPHVIDRVLRGLHVDIRGSSEAKIGVQRGAAHHNWKGGVTSLYARCREYFQRNIAPLVKERDGHRCVSCGSTSNLNVHHIISFNDILQRIKSEHPDLKDDDDKEELYQIIINDEQFNDIENLTTYCESCHRMKHKTISSQAAMSGRFNDHPAGE